MGHMKFFTREWTRGMYPDDEAEAVFIAFQQHVERIALQIPGDLLKVATSYSLHDALIQGVRLDKTQSQLAMTLRCGDLQRGYSDAVLHYLGLRESDCTIEQLRVAAIRNDTEILYNEVDAVEPGVYEHRYLCWPSDEFVLQFTGFTLQITPARNREFIPMDPRFAVVS